ncbi:MAG: glucose-1-phosphate cytidylyltransferase [Planctomycetota bacterium]
MKTMILCGGQGTRLREETEYRPKPLVEIGGRPILWHIMKIYSASGFHDFVLCLGYRGQMIKDYFLRYHAMNHDFTLTLGREENIHFHEVTDETPFTVTLAETGLSTMTGGRVRRAAKYIDDDTFMLTYGDGVADIDLKSLTEFHKAHGKLATITVMRPLSRFGMLDLAPDGTVERFVEKPRIDTWASAGFFVMNRRVFDYLDSDTSVLEQEPLERLSAEGELVAYRHEGFFFAMDTYREVLHLNQLWDRQQAPWKTW